MRRWIVFVGLSLSLIAGLVLYRIYQRSSPERWTAGNLLPNPDWNMPADTSPDLQGWTISGDVQRVDASQGYVLDGTYAMRMRGNNSWARSPEIKASNNQRFRIAYQGLIDPGTATGSIEARVAVWIHWIDSDGDDIKLDKHAAQTLHYAADGRPTWTPILIETAATPSGATSVAFSLHTLTDEVILIDNLQLNAAGLYIDQWPNGATAAVSFSVDWETAMGGYIHTRSTDPYNIEQATAIGERSRQGSLQLLKMLEANGISGTWFGNGYNFLSNNTDRRTWMGDPIFSWGTPEHGWVADWSQRKWFSDDPYQSVSEAPGWYFGDLVEELQTSGQSIQSHTFSHLYVGLATLSEWQSDLQAWNDQARAAGVQPASALAFPWGSSGGMTDAHWSALEKAGIDTIVRSHLPSTMSDTADPLLLIDRQQGLARTISGRNILIIPDHMLLPTTAEHVSQALSHTVAVGGVIDIWAHTSEIADSQQIAVWQSFIERTSNNPQYWVANVPEIATYWRAIQHVQAEITTGNGSQDQPYLIQIHNRSASTLHNVSIRLPESLITDAANITINQDQMLIDLAPHSTTEIRLWHRS